MLTYDKRGVSATKEDVHKAIEGLDKGLFPGAFAKVYPDYLTNDDSSCVLMGADGSGTKSSLAISIGKKRGICLCGATYRKMCK